MSLTGFDLRRRVRRRLVRLLDRLVAVLEEPAPPPPEAAAPAAPPPAPAPAPAPVAAREPLPPLPTTPRPAPRADAPSAPNRPPSADPAPAIQGETEAAAKAKASPEERQAKHWARTRTGLLRFVHDQGGRASLRDLHAYSERTFFVAHVAFSRMMEELTDEGLLAYDHDTAQAALTDAGLAELAEA